jgi:hypothetical protein
VAAAGEGAAAVAEACGAEGVVTDGKASNFFILPPSESKVVSSESNYVESLETSSSRSLVTSGSMALGFRFSEIGAKIDRTWIGTGRAGLEGATRGRYKKNRNVNR